MVPFALRLCNRATPMQPTIGHHWAVENFWSNSLHVKSQTPKLCIMFIYFIKMFISLVKILNKQYKKETTNGSKYETTP